MKLKAETCSQARKLEHSIGQVQKNSYAVQVSNDNDAKVYFLQLSILLDTEMKNYKGRVYGIIDAIGTLGGAFEIISWIVLLLYGSIRQNLYLFSVANSLTQNYHDQQYESRDKVEQINDTMIRSRYRKQRDTCKLTSSQKLTHSTITRKQTNPVINRNFSEQWKEQTMMNKIK